jgi:hypothetical protein
MFITRRKLMRRTISGALGALVLHSIRGFGAEVRTPEFDANLDELLFEWAELAEWQEISAPYPAPLMHNSVLGSMSRKYVKDYFEKYGELPAGCHRVIYYCGQDPACDVYSRHCGDTRQYDKVFTYPLNDTLLTEVMKNGFE